MRGRVSFWVFRGDTKSCEKKGQVEFDQVSAWGPSQFGSQPASRCPRWGRYHLDTQHTATSSSYLHLLHPCPSSGGSRGNSKQEGSPNLVLVLSLSQGWWLWSLTHNKEMTGMAGDSGRKKQEWDDVPWYGLMLCYSHLQRWSWGYFCDKGEVNDEKPPALVGQLLLISALRLIMLCTPLHLPILAKHLHRGPSPCGCCALQ